MNLKKLIIFVFCIMIFSVGLVSASELEDNSYFENNLNSVESNDLIQNEDLSDNINGDGLSEEDSCVVYVDEKGDGENGNGSKENPFTSLDSACISVNEYKNDVTVNILDGTYKIDKELKFNTSVLKINGVGSNVILKNLYDTTSAKQSFGLIELNNGKFIMSNIIFDASDWHQKNARNRCFSPFNNGDNNQVNFNNCTFIGFNDNNVILPHSLDDLNNYNNYTFDNCKFSNFTNKMHMGNAVKCDVSFINCVFSAKFENGLGMDEANNVVFDRCWFGYNEFNDNRMFTNLNPLNGVITPRSGITQGIYKFTKYAIFDVNENYLGNNKYEIVGQLKWNDGTTDNIDKLGPMTVLLSADSGTIPNNVTLIDGSFKVDYIASSDIHEITAILDHQKIILKNNFNFSCEDLVINYGDDQNITINFENKVNGTVYLNVNNHTYYKYCDDQKTVSLNINDVLPKGSYVAQVSFTNDDITSNEGILKIFGYNTTKITVNGLNSYIFDYNVTPNLLYIGDNATVTLSLPDGANGTVTIKVGDNNAKTFNVNETVIIDGFVAGDNVVNVTYNGNDVYDAKSVVKNVVASAKPTTLTTVDVTTTYNVAKDLVITLTDVNGKVLANKTINVVVGTINKDLTTNDSGQVGIDISSLAPNTYTANIAFAGDEIYNKSSTTAKVTVKEEIKTNITIPEIVAGKATTTTITLPQNATGNVTVIVDGNVTSVVNLTNGSATVTIPELPAGKHNVTISYSGDDNYAGFAQTSAVEVKEPAKPTPKPDDQKPVTVKKTATKITAKKKTFKAKTKVKKYTITLKAGKKAVKKVQVILKIGKKTYKAKTNAKGKATFKIKKLTKKGKYNAKITFKGNKLYKATTKKVKITVKK